MKGLNMTIRNYRAIRLIEDAISKCEDAIGYLENGHIPDNTREATGELHDVSTLIELATKALKQEPI